MGQLWELTLALYCAQAEGERKMVALGSAFYLCGGRRACEAEAHGLAAMSGV